MLSEMQRGFGLHQPAASVLSIVLEAACSTQSIHSGNIYPFPGCNQIEDKIFIVSQLSLSFLGFKIMF